MKKVFYLLLVAFCAITPRATAEALKIDFGTSSSPVQSGFQAYNASHEVDSSFGSRTYSSFNTTITVTPTWATGAVPTAKQALDRGNTYGYSTATEDMLNLVQDWIGTDQREIGDPMTLTISGLPAGSYSWISYHHDTQNQNGHFSVTVNDKNGARLTAGLQISSSQSASDYTLADVTKFETQIVSDGVTPITFIWDATDTANFNTMFVMNGFEISDGKAVIVEAANAPLRRTISPSQPMWLVHVDTWNWPDPQKIIDLIPADIRPYVVFDLSLSISHDTDTGKFNIVEYGYETAKSWLRTCAENRVWAMIQPSSGGFCHFSDYDLTVYEEFFREYPNFLGFNYCEQFWGFDDKWSVPWETRVNHFANLLKLSDRYGGYLVVSWCGNQWSPNINPIAMLKRVPAFASASQKYSDNYILCEKYTQQSYQSDMESICLGAYLSGYSGQYGIRYDSTGWTDSTGANANFTMATGLAAHLEHIMLTGQTVIDGPELIWQECFQGLNNSTTSDGYTTRRWGVFSQFTNVSIEIFRKILDGTVRIPSRQEVIDRTKFVIINNVNSGGNDDIYSTPATLFEGLYRMDGDGNLMNNKTFFKKTGRYPTIPTVYQLRDTVANSFQFKLNKSALSSRWSSIASKVTEFNSQFPEEYTGDIYAGRHENGWVIYNPYKTGINASGSVPFKYNTCEKMEIDFSQYSATVVKEYSDKVVFYLNNYDNKVNTGLKTDIIKIYGSTAEPTISYTERGSHQASTVTKNWAAGICTITVMHNGALDLTVNCAGTGTGRLTAYKTIPVTAPAKPTVYNGPQQYEGECFDYKSASCVTNGVSGSIRYYSGQGYMNFGTNSSASVRDYVTVPKAGTYRLETKYATEANVNTVGLYVNGVRVATPAFNATATLSDWAINKQLISLNAGSNTIEFRATATGASALYLDNMVIIPTVYGDGIIIQENSKGFASLEGAISNVNAGFTGDGYADTADLNGAGINWNVSLNSTTLTKAFTFRYAATVASSARLIINDTLLIKNIQFPATGSLTSWNIITVYTAANAGLSDIRLESTSATGLPNIDYIEIVGGGSETLLPTPSIAPLADTYSRDGSYADTNFGTDTHLDVNGSATSGLNRECYLKFDVHTLAQAQSVKLKLTPYQVDGSTTLTYQVTADNWTESALTWNNRPTAGTNITTASGYVSGQPVYIDITNIANTEATGDGILSLRITATTANGLLVGFASKESADSNLRPALEYLMAEAPSAPENLTATAASSGTQINLNWAEAARAVRYNVYRSTTSGGPYTIAARNVDGTAYSDAGLSAQTTYYYVVIAVNNIGESTPGTEAQATTAALPIISPLADAYVRDGGYANSNYGTDITLSNKYDGNVGSGYNRNSFLKFNVSGLANAQSVKLKLTPNQVDGVAVLNFEAIANDTWTETGINWNNQPAAGTIIASRSNYTVGTQFEIDVTSAAKAQAAGDGILSIRINQPTNTATRIDFNSKENSNVASRPVLEYTMPVIIIPTAPKGLNAVAGNNTVSLTWNANTEEDLTGYNIYRSAVSANGYVKLNSSLLTNPAYTDNNVINDTTYYYVVTAVDADNDESIYSSEVSAMPVDSSIVTLNSLDFENGLGDWVNITGEDSHDWFHNSGVTLTANTGPDIGANGSTWYIYLETTAASVSGNTAILQSPAIHGFGRTLSFYYHMYGIDSGTLAIDIFDGTWHYDAWSISGQQQNTGNAPYTRTTVDLTDYAGPITIRIRAVAKGGVFGDIAVDDIKVTGKPLYGDSNGDKLIDLNDLTDFAGIWLQENCELDLNGDCQINLYEFNQLARYWLDNSLQ